MKRIFYFLSILFLFSCSNSKNSTEFINNVKGRYLFNSNETLEIYFEENILKVKWRGQDMTPIKANDSSFYLKEMNEKLVFVSQPKIHIELAPKREHEGEKFSFSKLKNGEKTAIEYFKNKEYEKAMAAYRAIQKKDSLDPTINWRSINNLAHDYFQKEKNEEAFKLFAINIAMYPKKPSVYRNIGYAYMKIRDTIKAIESYKRALKINPDDSRALRFFKKHNLKRND